MAANYCSPFFKTLCKEKGCCGSGRYHILWSWDPGMDRETIFFTGRGGPGRGKAKNLWGGVGRGTPPSPQRGAGRGRGQNLQGWEGPGQGTVCTD